MLNLQTGTANVALGYRAMEGANAGDYNVAIGTFALTNNTTGGIENIAIGHDAGLNNSTGTYNLFVGNGAGHGSGGSNFSMFLGYRAGFTYTGSGSNNLFLGSYAGEAYGAGVSNVLVGDQAGKANTTSGNKNVFIGYLAGSGVAGDENIYLGTGGVPTTGNNNVVIGKLAGGTSGNNNIMLGAFSGTNNTGSNNTYLGKVDISTATQTGFDFGKNSSNSIILADGAGNERLVIDSVGFAGIGLGDDDRAQNRLEIGTGLNGTAGLRFRGINSTSAPVTNPSANVLSVNANGDVILVPDGGSGSGGGTTSITAGSYTTVSGTGAPATPYTINAQNLYTNDGMIDTPESGVGSGVRTIIMGNNNIFFKTTTAQTDYGKGKVFIGSSESYPTTSPTPNSNYKLLVEGGILTEKVKVATKGTANWADYVFDDNYNLPSLKEVEAYIQTENHLPNIPSADEIACDGLDLADMQAKQMAKIEELTLYVIEQEKTMAQQSEVISELKAQLDGQKEEIEELKRIMKSYNTTPKK
ncbi:MAG TPA: hypothetical protein VK183_00470 [Flavobacterium sp.]|nr:hypothetical protein [Flavobacterium sp.]